MRKIYRPCLTIEEINRLVTAAKKESFSPELKSAIDKLEVFQFKAERGITTPSYTNAVKGVSLSDLGVEAGNASTDVKDIRRLAYDKSVTKGRENCSADELIRADTYAFESGYMSEEERLAFEEKLMNL